MMVLEIALIVLYLVLVIFVFNTTKLLGIILVVVATGVIFPGVIVMDRKREQTMEDVGGVPGMEMGTMAAQPSSAQLPPQTPPQMPPTG